MSEPTGIPFYFGDELTAILNYDKLIPALKKAFQSNYTAPQRSHFDIANPQDQQDTTLLLMPAWETGQMIGVKLVTVCPENSKYNLPAIQGIYVLFDGKKGTPLALLDAKILTKKRTAATSALASSFLSRPESSSMLMIGTGALAPELIRAHAKVRPLSKIFVWGRNYNKAMAVAQTFQDQEKFEVVAIESFDKTIKEVDIISCATLSETALVKGEQLVPGQHLDLVGSFKPTMREADDTAIAKSSVYIDHEGATFESGDISEPLRTGVISKEDIRGDLFQLCKGLRKGRKNNPEITLFKSVGHALEDLAAAQLIMNK